MQVLFNEFLHVGAPLGLHIIMQLKLHSNERNDLML